MNFRLDTQFKPRGDQINAILQLTQNIQRGANQQVLYGVTGSGKTFTAASVIERINKPTLVISHNKTLAWQLYEEFKGFFPDNSVHYFVSYYDYYQPEAYLPAQDVYISKDAAVNPKIDKMRHAAVQSILTRPDTIVVASVSCIYNLGSPETYQKVTLNIRKGQPMVRRDFLKSLIALGFARNDIDTRAGTFRAKADRVEIHPASGDEIIVVTLDNKSIESIRLGQKEVPEATLFPASFWLVREDKIKIALSNIRAELHERIGELKKAGKEIEAYRIEQKTNYDLELIETIGYCSGIENYSRHLEFRDAGSAPFTLLKYFPDDFLTFLDESHMTIPQIRGMHAGDQARKTTLIEHGFRLPSAIDNRPLTFEEYNQRITGPTIYMSATPKEYEMSRSQMANGPASTRLGEAGKSFVVEQIIRPTGLLDPSIEIRTTENQMADAIEEIKKVKEKGQRALVVTITKRLAEDIAEYMQDKGLKVAYIHSEIRTLDRIPIMQKLRLGEYDVLVGVNLLREGLDFPEVSLMIIFDADKEGFLRNETTLLQTMGRAARHVEGRAIMYADRITGSMRAAIRETERRRKIQKAHNKKHRITPRSIIKKIRDLPEEISPLATSEVASGEGLYEDLSHKELEREMKKAARDLDFEKAAQLRDEMKK